MLIICLSNVTSNWLQIRSTTRVSQLPRFGASTDLVEISETIVDCLKQRRIKEESLHELFKPGEMMEITQGPFKDFVGFFEKLQTLPDGLSRAVLLV